MWDETKGYECDKDQGWFVIGSTDIYFNLVLFWMANKYVAIAYYTNHSNTTDNGSSSYLIYAVYG
ncbi:hypothetical protein GCM10009001_09130 [Virgibacillus siamensis]|uniref:Uncharacterized protein n=1 Tax=Virgibacillus siamensis TaxID=480071 RepID=A0ABP3QVT2_9BACI